MDRAREPSLQERYAPASVCFGCGPANASGLHVRSFEDESVVGAASGALVASWAGRPEHQAFPGVLNGGIVGALLDCHANWAAAIALMRAEGAPRPPATVTASYEVRMLLPTPADRPVTLHARVTGHDGRRAHAEAAILVDGVETATFTGTFVAVRPGHPAYHRWDEGVAAPGQAPADPSSAPSSDATSAGR
jgi:acyl-coenzyme A thioesterase PaaI-like protein